MGKPHPPQPDPRLGAALSAALKAAGVLQDDLGPACGRSQATISRWINGGLPRLDLIRCVEDVLKLRRGELLVRAGYVEMPTVVGAVLADDVLQEHQRRFIIESYESAIRVGSSGGSGGSDSDSP